jgi:cellulose synthase/poly-beta-1,6-N-acetylglucosamine synthase-like glycosyltransferase
MKLNESTGVLATLADIKHQLLPGDRLVVVADNCTDDTATLASNAGAEVIERHDLTRIGKGFALDFGIQHLRLNPPNIVMLLDADCRLAKDAINQLAATCAETGRPVQALYLMTQPEQSAINHRVAEFAWRLKNWIRPLGLNALGLPCQLMGTGMAVPWEIIGSVNLASGRIVEDLQLGLDLAKAGHFPIFCPAARVSSEFASSAKGAVTQRERWEHGHIGTILNMAPQLAWQALRQRNKDLLALALDLAVPPLSLLVMLVSGLLLLNWLLALFGFSAIALFISIGTFSVLLLTTILAWLKCGQSVLPPAAILSIAPYVIGKIGLYGRILVQRVEGRWIRTDRTKSG